MTSLLTRIGSVELKSPLMAASGTWAYGLEFLDHPLQDSLGAFVTKSLSVNGSEGNPMPRFYETDSGMLNSIGLQNMGIDEFLARVEPELKKRRSPYILSIYGQKIDDFKILAAKAKLSSALAIELNISCPNVDKGGLEFSSDPKTTESLVTAVRKEFGKPLWVKLSPNVTSIVDIALAAESAGADSLVLINTLVGMSINHSLKKPWLGRSIGGLSGPVLKPIALERVFRCFKRVKIPLVGVGGISSAKDVFEFLMAGASAVQVGTWNFRDPFCYSSIAKDMRERMEKEGWKSPKEIVGLGHS